MEGSFELMLTNDSSNSKTLTFVYILIYYSADKIFVDIVNKNKVI